MAASYRWPAGQGGIDSAVLPLESGSEEGVSLECRQIRSLRFPGYLGVIRLVTAKLCPSEIFPVLFEHVSGVLHPPTPRALPVFPLFSSCGAEIDRRSLSSTRRALYLALSPPSILAISLSYRGS